MRAAALLAVLLAAPAAPAQSRYSWIGGNSSQWSNSDNWIPYQPASVLPVSFRIPALFRTVDLETDRTVHSVQFGGNHPYELINGRLILAVGSIEPDFQGSEVRVEHSIRSPVIQGASGTWSITNFDLHVSGPISDGGAGSNLFKIGVGTLRLSGASTIGGDFGVQEGNVVLAAGGLTSGRTIVGYNTPATFTQVGGNHAVANSVAIGFDAGSSGGRYALGGGTLSAPLTYVGLNGSGAFAQSAGTHALGEHLVVAFSPGFSGTYDLTGGTLAVTGNTYVGDHGTGAFTQTGGTHTVAGQLILGANPSGNGTYILAGGTLQSGGGGVTRGQGTGTLHFAGGTWRAAADTVLTGLTAATVRIGGAVIDTNGRSVTVAQPLLHDPALGATPDGGLTKLGPGTLTLTGANTYTGGTTVAGGTVKVANDTLLGAASGTVTLLNGGTVAFTDLAFPTRRTWHLGTSALAPAAGGTINYVGATVNGGALGAGNHVLRDGSRLDGVRVRSGAAVNQVGPAVMNDVLFAGTSTFTLDNSVILNATGDFTAGPQTTLTLNGTVNAAGGALSGAVTVNDRARLATAGAPLYLDGSRGTRVNAGGTLAAAAGSTIELGGLLVNNGTQSGTLNVNYGGLVKGAGTFGAVNVTDGGKFAPGNSPGRVTTGDGTSWGAGGRYEWEVNDVTGNAGGPNGWDVWDVAGRLHVTAGTTANSRFTIEVVGLAPSNAPGTPANFNATQAYQWTIATASGGVSGFDAGKFTLDASSFTAPGTFSLTQSGNAIVLSFTPVPEPATTLAVLLGGAAAGSWWRRRKMWRASSRQADVSSSQEDTSA